MHELKKVTNPRLQEMDEIANDYWDNWLLISNLTDNPESGIVQYYCYIRDDKLTNIIMEMDKNYDSFGECIIRFIGPSRGYSLGGLFL
jgi:hypothetical protein